MRWPWISRTLHEEIVDQLKAELTHSYNAFVRSAENFNKLVAETIKMQRDGFHLPTPRVELEAGEPLVHEIEAAISTVMNANGETARQVRTWAYGQLKAGRDPKIVAQSILDGEG